MEASVNEQRYTESNAGKREIDVYKELRTGRCLRRVHVKGNLYVSETIQNLYPSVEETWIGQGEEEALQCADLIQITPRS